MLLVLMQIELICDFYYSRFFAFLRVSK
jgi:hypothetical protein